MSARTESPCVRICKLDPDGAFCVGCGRSLSEIAAWPRATAQERAAILDAAARRPTREAKAGRRSRR